MRNLPLLIGGCFFFILLVFATVGPYLPFIDNQLQEVLIKQDESGRFRIPPYAPSQDNLLGTDYNGRDMLSLLVIGTRETLMIVFAAGIMRYLIAIPLGAAAVYFKFVRWLLNGWNYLLSFIPPIFLVALFIGIPFFYFSDHLFFWFLFIIAIVEVGRVAEIFRNQIVYLSGNEFIQAAVTTGTTRFGLMWRHYLPHLRPQIIQQFVMDLGRVLFLMAQLAVVEIFISSEFVSQLGGGYKPLNTSLAYPGFLQSIMRDMWMKPWIPYSTVLFISFMIITFLMLSEGIKNYYKKKHRAM
ncbi:ABC transporter permease [Pseudoneobacillus sp. C159]